MKKTIFRCAIWVVIIAVLTTARIYVSKNAIGNNVTDCYETDEDAVVADTMSKTGYIYVVADNTINHLFSCHKIGRGIKAIEVYETDDNIFALITTVLSNETVYNVIEFDSSLNQVAKLGWVTLAQEGTVTDMEIYDSSIYITQLSSDGRIVYEYAAALTNLQSGEEKISILDSIETSKWNASDTEDCEDGTILADAYLENGEIVTVTMKGNTITKKDQTIAEGQELLQNATLSTSQFNYRFQDQFLQMILLGLVGLLLIIIVPLELKKHNRIAYMVTIWEVILCVMLATYWLGYDTFCKYATVPVLFLAGTIMGVMLFWFQGVDLHKLAEGMRDVVENNGEIKKEEAYGQDMNFLWNALVELGAKIKKINYSKYQMYEAYYRFSPKGMETLLNKDSMQDVASDDMINLTTTVALTQGRMFVTEGPAGTGQMIPKKFLEMISEYQENRKGVLISMASDMYQSMFMFARDYHLAQSFGNEYFNILKNSKVRHWEGKHIVLFHNCNMTYGVVGTKQQSCQYVYSNEVNELTKKLSVLEDLGLDFVMTKSAYDAEEHKPVARYIGELKLNGVAETLPLYQVLDALPNAKRVLYLENKELFEKGIELMKQQDYYLARNAFAEELRVLPEDGMARWYLYLCEKYLDDPDEKVSFVIK